MLSLSSFPKRVSRTSAIALAIALAAVLGAVDYLTGPFFSITVFYLFPVALAAWYAGRREALLVSLLCVVVWTGADFESLRTRPPLAMDLWNGAVRVAFFVTVSYTLTTAKRALDRESTLAREIQSSLLPTSLPRFEGIDIAAVYRPAKDLSGDYFDALPAPNGGLVLCIADITGKGAGPALLMANLQAAVRLLVPTGCAPADLCRRLNELISGHGIPSRLITFFACRIDRARMRLSYSNAGHNPPILFREDGSLRRLSEGGLVLGASASARYTEEDVPLMPGDELIVYTDGLTEATDRAGREFGEERVIEVVASSPGAPASDVQARLIQQAERFNAGSFRDDVTLVVLRLQKDAGAGMHDHPYAILGSNRGAPRCV